jgi:hypothetical protein
MGVFRGYQRNQRTSTIFSTNPEDNENMPKIEGANQ